MLLGSFLHLAPFTPPVTDIIAPVLKGSPGEIENCCDCAQDENEKNISPHAHLASISRGSVHDCPPVVRVFCFDEQLLRRHRPDFCLPVLQQQHGQALLFPAGCSRMPPFYHLPPLQISQNKDWGGSCFE